MAIVKNITGAVVEKQVGGASKSARLAVVLEAREGDFILRRPGGNAFSDPELQKLVGKQLRVSGDHDGHTLFMDSWDEVQS